MEAVTTTMAIELGFAGVVFAFLGGIVISGWVINRFFPPSYLDNMSEWDDDHSEN